MFTKAFLPRVRHHILPGLYTLHTELDWLLVAQYLRTYKGRHRSVAVNITIGTVHPIWLCLFRVLNTPMHFQESDIHIVYPEWLYLKSSEDTRWEQVYWYVLLYEPINSCLSRHWHAYDISMCFAGCYFAVKSLIWGLSTFLRLWNNGLEWGGRRARQNSC